MGRINVLNLNKCNQNANEALVFAVFTYKLIVFSEIKNYQIFFVVLTLLIEMYTEKKAVVYIYYNSVSFCFFNNYKYVDLSSDIVIFLLKLYTHE